MFDLQEVKPQIFCAVFDDPYQLAMTFWRYQEFYESSDPRIKGQSFSLIDHMEKYADEKGAFTYADDWGGFNIPGYIIHDVVKKGIPDFNKYDCNMLAIESMIRARGCEGDFYLIGVPDSDEEGYLEHELAHGLFYVNDKYRREMTRLVNKLPQKKKEAVFEALRAESYCEDVLVDETQAYCATGVLDGWKEIKLGKEVKAFEAAFKKYAKA